MSPPPEAAPAKRRAGKIRRRRIVLLCLLLAFAYPGATYVRALTYPGEASFAVRSVDWLRDMVWAER